jgi:hypothetical protein
MMGVSESIHDLHILQYHLLCSDCCLEPYVALCHSQLLVGK